MSEAVAWKVPPPHVGIIRVTDDTTAAELEEALDNLRRYALVCRRHRVADESESPYERTHRQIDTLLAEWQARRGQAPAPDA